MNKVSVKIITVVLTALLCVCALLTVSAFDDVPADDRYYEAISSLYSKKVVAGVSEAKFAPDANVTRWQMALFISRAKTGITDDSHWREGDLVFEDCSNYLGAIQYSYTQGVIKGVSQTRFAPDNNITLRDGLIMAVRALGYEKEDEGVDESEKKYNAGGPEYWKPYYIKALEIGLLRNLNDLDMTKALSRAETAQLIYNMLNAKLYGSNFTLEEEIFQEKIEDVKSNRIPAVIVETPLQSFESDTIAENEKRVLVEYHDGENVGRISVDFDKLTDASVDVNNIEKYLGMYVELVNCPKKDDGSDVLDYGKFEYIDGIDDKSRYLCDESDIEYFISENCIGIKGDKYSLEDGGVNQINLFFSPQSGKTYLPNSSSFYSGYAGKRFEAQFYDMDLDGIFECGIILPVNLAKYSSPSSSRETCGVMAVSFKGEANYTPSRPKKDEIFAYTYNSLLNEVNVVSVMTTRIGEIKGISEKLEENHFGKMVDIDYILTSDGAFRLPETSLRDEYYIVNLPDYVSTELIIEQIRKTYYISQEYYVCDGVFIGFGNPAPVDYTNPLIFSKLASDEADDYIYATVYINGDKKDIKISSVRTGNKYYNVSRLKYDEKKELMNGLEGLYTYETGESSVYSLTKVEKLNELSAYISNDSVLAFEEGVASDCRTNAKALRVSPTTKIFVHDTNTGIVNKITPAQHGTFSFDISPESKFYADRIGYGSTDNGHGIASFLYVTVPGGNYFDYSRYKIVYVMEEVAEGNILKSEDLAFAKENENTVYTAFETNGSAYVVSTLDPIERMYISGNRELLTEGLYVVDDNGVIANHIDREELRPGESWIEVSDGNSMLYKVVKLSAGDIDFKKYSSVLINGIDLLESNRIRKVRFNFKITDGDNVRIEAKGNYTLVKYLDDLDYYQDIDEVAVLVVPNKYDDFDLTGTYPADTFCGIVLDPVEINE